MDLSGGAAVQTGFASATQGVFSLSLDTTNPTWTAQWSDSSGAIGTQPQYNLSSATQTALGGAGNVGFLLVNTANNKTISVDLNSFSLATNASAVPGPTGVVAGLLIAIGLIRRRR